MAKDKTENKNENIKTDENFILEINHFEIMYEDHQAYLLSGITDSKEEFKSRMAFVDTYKDQIETMFLARYPQANRDNFMSLMYKIINMINQRLASGAFIISDDENAIMFKNSVSVFSKLGDDQAASIIGYKMLESLLEVNNYIDMILGLNDGSRAYEDCLESLETNI